MKGKIQTFTEETKDGSIKGDDGKTYTISSLSDEVDYSTGQVVEFTADGRKATKVRVYTEESGE